MNEQPLSNKVPLVKAKQIMFSYYQLGLDVCDCAGDVFIVLCVCVCVYRGWLWFICCVFLYGVSVGLRVNDKVWRVCDWFGQRVHIIRLPDIDKVLWIKGKTHNTAHTVILIICKSIFALDKVPLRVGPKRARRVLKSEAIVSQSRLSFFQRWFLSF